LSDAGALALVVVEVVPVGLMSYSKDECHQSAHEGRMPMVSIYQPRGEACSQFWDNRHILIDGPHDETFISLFDSLAWLVVMRILLPLFAFATSAMAISVLYIGRKKGSELGIVDFICVIEAICNIIIGLLLIFGQFGPTDLPLNVHLEFTTLLMGASLITSLALALFLRGGALFVQTLKRRKSVLINHKFLLFFGSICVFMADVIWIIVVGIFTDNQRDIDSVDLTLLYVCSVSFVILCQGIVCVYVLYQVSFFSILYIFTHIE
jgi:hypothetical protein